MSKRAVFGTWGYIDAEFATRERLLEVMQADKWSRITATAALSPQQRTRTKKRTDANPKDKEL